MDAISVVVERQLRPFWKNLPRAALSAPLQTWPVRAMFALRVTSIGFDSHIPVNRHTRTPPGGRMRYAEFGLITQIETGLAESARFFPTAENPSSALPGEEAFPFGSYNGLVNALSRGLKLQPDSEVSDVQPKAFGVTVSTSQGEYRESHPAILNAAGTTRCKKR